MPDGAGNPATSITLPGQGTYQLYADTHVITFSPAGTFVGYADPVAFRVTDNYGQHGDAGYFPRVYPPNAPQAQGLQSTGYGTAPQTATVTLREGDSATLLDGGNAADSVTVAEQGTFTLDPATGVITFQPVPGYYGDTQASYRVTDEYGSPTTSTYTAHTLLPDMVPPIALTSSGTGTAVQSASFTTPLRSCVTLLDGTTATSTVVNPAEGTYSLSQVNTFTCFSFGGDVRFAPVLGFAGAATPVTYQVTDIFGRIGTATYTPYVNTPAAPTASALTSTGKAGAAQHQHVAVPAGGSVRLLNRGVPTASLSIAGQGSYLADPTTGELTFTPAAYFAGKATAVTFRATDAYGQHADATYTATVVPNGAPSASAPRLVTLATAKSTVPVTCKLTIGAITRCDVVLTTRVGGRDMLVGSGSRLVPGAGVARQTVVGVTLNTLGHHLAAFLGGVPATATATLTETGSVAKLHASTTTTFVNARVNATRPVYFESSSARLRPSERGYLDRLRTKLAGVRTISCTGHTDNTDNTASFFSNWLLGASRAASVCDYLIRGTHIRVGYATIGESHPVASNGTRSGRQLNRRTDIQLGY